MHLAKDGIILEPRLFFLRIRILNWRLHAIVDREPLEDFARAPGLSRLRAGRLRDNDFE